MRVIINNERYHFIQCDNFPAAGTTPEIVDAHNQYIQNKLPAGVKIAKFFHNADWASDVAKFLNAELVRIDPEHKQFPASVEAIRANPELYLDQIHPLVAQRLSQLQAAKAEKKPLFSEIIDSSFLEPDLSADEKTAIQTHAENLNPGYDRTKLKLCYEMGLLASFNHHHLPALIGELKDKAAYSQQRGLANT